jgi:hypothetical protein
MQLTNSSVSNLKFDSRILDLVISRILFTIKLSGVIPKSISIAWRSASANADSEATPVKNASFSIRCTGLPVVVLETDTLEEADALKELEKETDALTDALAYWLDDTETDADANADAEAEALFES